MGLPSSGAISLSQIQAEFGGSNPISISEYYGSDSVPSSGSISLSHFHGTSALTVYTFSVATHTNVDLDTLGIAQGGDVLVVIPSGAVLVATSVSNYALKTGTGWAASLTIQNNGKILGRGGRGGHGGNSTSSWAKGTGKVAEAGGKAIHVEHAVTIDNNGILSGGGGGGGSTGGVSYFNGWGYYRKGGNGGGGGAPNGDNGWGGNGSNSSGYSGSDGTLTAGGAGGGSSHSGGTGGSYGASGVAAAAAPNGNYGPSGTVGAGGATYYNPSSFTVTQI